MIEQELQGLVQEKHVRLLYACESGSRAWGFASPDSDYDIRFLYVHPKDAYLRLDSPQDTLDRIIGDLDISGWDIFKALRLLRKSNPPLMEWLFSPVVYAENTPYIQELRRIARQAYSSSAVFYHYSRMAYRNYHQYLENRPEVLLKKYLYVMRPMVALFYLEQFHDLPPTNFIETLESVVLPQGVREGIMGLIDRKQAGHELGTGLPDPILNAFADRHLKEWIQNDPEKDGKKQDFRELDAIA